MAEGDKELKVEAAQGALSRNGVLSITSGMPSGHSAYAANRLNANQWEYCPKAAGGARGG